MPAVAPAPGLTVERIDPQLMHLVVPIDSLVPDPDNARLHGDRNMDAIVASLKRFGQKAPLVVRSQNRVVAAGNGRLAAAKKLGWKRIAASFSVMTDAEFSAFALADNRTAELAEWNSEAVTRLESLLSATDPDLVIGWSASELKALRAEGFKRRTDPDAVPPTPPVPASKLGDLWALGEHRLVCGRGDALPDVQKLMGKTKAVMVWTDPPYGVDYVGKTKSELTIQNDSAAGLEELLCGAWRSATWACIPAAPVYCTGPSGDRGEVFLRSMRETGLVFKQYLIWLKNRMILGRSDYHYKHEPMFYAHTPGPKMGRTTAGRLHWYGPDNCTSIFEVDSPPANREHPTMKPVKLIQMCLANSTRAGEVVLDLFMGSGSTLVAAHEVGRVAYGTELDPIYCDVILQRYLDFTGDDPLRLPDRVRFSKVKEFVASRNGKGTK